MPECFVCLVAKNVTRDADSNAVSLFHIIEDISPLGLPFFIPEIAALTMWRVEENDPDKIEIQFRVRNNEETLVSSPLILDFSNNVRTHRSVVNISPLLVKEVGTLKFEYLHNNEVVAHYSVRVRAADPAVVVDQAPPAPALPG